MTVAKRLPSGEGQLVRVLSRGMTFVHSSSAIITDCTRRRLSMAIDGESSHPARPLQRKRRRLASPDADRVGAERPTPAQSLIDDYNTRRSATDRFPPKITSRDIREAMQRYENVIEEACAGVEASCASCGEFSTRTTLHRIPLDDNRLHPLKSTEGIYQLDTCALEDASYGFCERCFLALHRGHIPKFSALNGVNVTMCHLYPAELEDLTLAEECAIARSHPIGTILKLKPNGFRSPAAYNAIRGHIVNIPQNPGPLLDILPSPALQFHEHIKIVWSSKTEPTEEDLKDFVQIRKDKVIRALLWLCEHNPLYGSVQVNHQLLAQWSDAFIPSVLQEALIRIPEDKDSEERGTYAGDMDGNFENDLHSALRDMADGTIASGAVYSDVEGHRQNPELKIVIALKEMLDGPSETLPDADSAEAAEVPVINWVGDRVLMNDYEDAEFFTGAFPTLFPYGKGGHLLPANERRVPISLETWAKWLLSHHSRRFVWKH